MSKVARVLKVLGTPETMKAKWGHLRAMRAEAPRKPLPSEHGETPATVDESDVK